MPEVGALIANTHARPQSVTTIINAVDVGVLTSTQPTRTDTRLDVQGTRADAGVLTSTQPTRTDTGSVTFTDTVLITPNAGGTVTLTPVNTLTFTRADTGGEISTDAITGGVLTGTNGIFTYTITAVQYAGPTINNLGAGVGNISYVLTGTDTILSTPEPATLSMVGMGLLSVGGLAFARRRGATV